MAGVELDLQEATITQLQDGLTAGRFTSVDLVKAYIARIAEVNDVLRAVTSVSPAALKAARELDDERQQGRVRSILHGIPIAVKENIATRVEDGMDTTAGSFALQGAVARDDADCVAKLRAAGAIILCKTNMSVWANFRGVAKGAWSPVGGQCTSPYYPRGHPSGSSSGSGVAAAVGLVVAAIGSETCGSIVSPAGKSSIVGLRPTVGLVSPGGVVPVAATRDSVGPMTKTVEDAAILLQAMADPPSFENSSADMRSGLQGLKLFVPTNIIDWEADKTMAFGQRKAFQEAVQILRDLGADICEDDMCEEAVLLHRDKDARHVTMEIECKADMGRSLPTIFSHIPSGIRDLKDIVQYTQNDKRESPYLYHTSHRFDSAMKRGDHSGDDYKQAKARIDRGIALLDREYETRGADAFVLLDNQPMLWSDAAYPQITVPLGYLGPDTPLWKAQTEDETGKEVDLPLELLEMHPNKPFCITIAGRAFSEATLLRIAYAFEQATQARYKGKTYQAATPSTQLPVRRAP